MREFYQAGVELLGLDKPEADAEMIAMTIEAFRAAGLERFQIDVGHVEFVQGVFESLGVGGTSRGRSAPPSDARMRPELARLVGELSVPSAGGPPPGAARSCKAARR